MEQGTGMRWMSFSASSVGPCLNPPKTGDKAGVQARLDPHP